MVEKTSTRALTSDLSQWRGDSPPPLIADTHARALIRINYGERLAAAWSCIAIGAVKADVWRLLAIYSHGGYYFDMDSGPKREHPFRSWKTGNLTMVSGTGRSVAEPHQWGLVYSPRHALIRRAIQKMLRQLVVRNQEKVQDIGYTPFQSAFTELHHSHPTDYRTVPGWGDCFGGRVHFNLPGNFDAHLRHTAHTRHWSSEEKKPGGIWTSTTCC